ncbi:MAG: adenylate/guanylate cyclase domain-containing protein [Alphaproteobacteria bacterium]|nr:adenylate/guanylate cyclase domain-containing protein [Alphaproteobacteria bacterium]
MPKQGTVRKLAAILSADVVAYSRLMGEDEEATLAELKAIRGEIIDPALQRRHGTVVKTMGDGLLIEFPSIVEAVRNAIEVQQAVQERGAGRPEAQRIVFRVGVNLGDVIVEDNDIYGDGVNIAARLQMLAQPGGVCISEDAYNQVRDKLEFEFADLGPREVKNMARPIRVWGWNSDASAATVTDGKAIDAAPGQAHEKPSIAVLPFVNMSRDPEQDFFTDGITEDILTELSRFRELLVISRTTSFAYKGRSISIPDVAKELDVQYVVEGSVRKAGNRIRVTVQLIDGRTDQHIWADKYDRDLEDIFEIQDELTQAIVATLPGRVAAAAQERAERKPTANMVAYECLLTGKRLHHRSTREDNAKAQEMLDQAIALDPQYAHAHAWKACVLGQYYALGFSEDDETVLAQIQKEITTAQALDDNDSDVHRILAALQLVYGDFDQAWRHQQRALSLNPNDDLIVVQNGEILTWMGKAEEGITWILKAMRLNPFHPERFWGHLGRAYFLTQQYAEALDAFRRIQNPNAGVNAFLASACARLDDTAGADRYKAAVLAQQADFSVESHLATLHYAQDADQDHHRQAMLQAGLPA